MPAVHKQKKRGSVGHEPQKRLWGRQIPIQGLMGTRAVCHEFRCSQNTLWPESTYINSAPLGKEAGAECVIV